MNLSISIIPKGEDFAPLNAESESCLPKSEYVVVPLQKKVAMENGCLGNISLERREIKYLNLRKENISVDTDRHQLNIKTDPFIRIGKKMVSHIQVFMVGSGIHLGVQKNANFATLKMPKDMIGQNSSIKNMKKGEKIFGNYANPAILNMIVGIIN